MGPWCDGMYFVYRAQAGGDRKRTIRDHAHSILLDVCLRENYCKSFNAWCKQLTVGYIMVHAARRAGRGQLETRRLCCYSPLHLACTLQRIFVLLQSSS